MNRSKFGHIVLSVSDKKRIKKIFEEMTSLPPMALEIPVPPPIYPHYLTTSSAHFNCSDDDAFKRLVRENRATYAKIFLEEYEKHKKKGGE